MAIQPTRLVRQRVSHRWDTDLNEILARNREAKEEEVRYKIWDRETDIYRLVRELISIKTKLTEKALPERYEEARDNIRVFKSCWGEFTTSEDLHIRQCVFSNNPTRRLEDYSLERTML